MARLIGALWSRKTKDGKTFLSGILNDLSGDIQIAVFKNDRKEKENQPDYQIILSQKKEEGKSTNNDDFFGNSEVIDRSEPSNDSEDEEIKVENIPF